MNRLTHLAILGVTGWLMACQPAGAVEPEKLVAGFKLLERSLPDGIDAEAFDRFKKAVEKAARNVKDPEKNWIDSLSTKKTANDVKASPAERESVALIVHIKEKGEIPFIESKFFPQIWPWCWIFDCD